MRENHPPGPPGLHSLNLQPILLLSQPGWALFGLRASWELWPCARTKKGSGDAGLRSFNP